ncbi:including n-acetylases of ribosomal protein [Naviculisporaceae sp. PSN 640]
MTDPSFQFYTPRLVISYLLPENNAHCDFLVELYNTPEFIASLGGEPTDITTREAAHKTLAGRFREKHARNGYGTFLFSLKPPEVENSSSSSAASVAPIPIGTVSLLRGEPPNGYTAPDLGFAILPSYMRKGYTKEAALGLLEWAEKERGVKDVLGLHDPGNEASYGVFRSLGFEDRGLRELEMFGPDVVGRVWTRPGMEEDLAVYGLPSDPCPAPVPN